MVVRARLGAHKILVKNAKNANNFCSVQSAHQKGTSLYSSLQSHSSHNQLICSKSERDWNLDQRNYRFTKVVVDIGSDEDARLLAGRFSCHQAEKTLRDVKFCA